MRVRGLADLAPLGSFPAAPAPITALALARGHVLAGLASGAVFMVPVGALQKQGRI